MLIQEKIQIGSCFTQQELTLLYQKSSTNKAVQKAYNLLSYRSHSRKELYDKLCRSFDSDCAEAACSKMEDIGLLNDEEFCKAKAEYLINVKKCSLGETRLKLLTLGINKDIIECCIESCSEDTQMDNLLHLLQTKYCTKLDNPQKVIASLMRKGFRYNEIRAALQTLDIETEDENQWL